MSENVSGEGPASDPMKTVADALEKAVQTATESAADAKATLEKSLPAASRFQPILFSREPIRRSN